MESELINLYRKAKRYFPFPLTAIGFLIIVIGALI